MNRIALYARVSSEIQEKEATIESQVALLHDAAKKHGDVIIQEYRDDGFSGDLLARPGLDRLRDDAKQGLFDRVLILSPDRLARKWVYGEVIADELRKHGVTIEYLNQKDDGTPESKLLLDMTGIIGQYEKAKILERFRRGRLFSVKQGAVLTSHHPYGYTHICKSTAGLGRLETNEDQARVVRFIFEQYAGGMEISTLAAELVKRGIPSPRGLRSWPRSTIMKILKNETFIGIWHYNKWTGAEARKHRNPSSVRRRVHTSRRKRPRDQWIPIQVAPIISRDLFDAAQRQLERARQFSRRNTQREYLLSGLMVCAGCGRKMGGTPSNGYAYYRCTANFSFGGIPAACKAKGVPSGRADAAVWTGLSDALHNPKLLAANLQATQEVLAADRKDILEERQKIAHRQAQLKITEARLLDGYTAGAISLDQLRDRMGVLKQELADLAGRLADLEKSKPVQLGECPGLDDFCRKIARGLHLLESDFPQRQAFFRSLVDRVVLSYDQATIVGALPLLVAPLPEPFRRLEVASLQWRSHNPQIRFELTVPVAA